MSAFLDVIALSKARPPTSTGSGRTICSSVSALRLVAPVRCVDVTDAWSVVKLPFGPVHLRAYGQLDGLWLHQDAAPIPTTAAASICVAPDTIQQVFVAETHPYLVFRTAAPIGRGRPFWYDFARDIWQFRARQPTEDDKAAIRLALATKLPEAAVAYATVHLGQQTYPTLPYLDLSQM